MLAILEGDDDSAPVPFDQLFPANDEISGYIENTSFGNAGVEVAADGDEAIALIDGSADPFIAAGFIEFGIEYYKNGDSELRLDIWQMNNAQVARTLYSDLTSTNAVYMSQIWTDLDIGQEGRIADTGAYSWVNARSGSYYIEAKINQVTDQGRADAQAFAEAVISKL